jgi:hypothetical protein
VSDAPRETRETFETLYTGEEYGAKHPDWHAERSPWKAEQILKMIGRNGLTPRTVCEVGCGAGEILNRLSQRMDGDVRFEGYEIAEQAYRLAEQRTTSRVRYFNEDVFSGEGRFFDLVLCIDVIEHVEDIYGILRRLRGLGKWKILHIPLDLSAQTVLRRGRLVRQRARVGHIHYFTKELALRALQDTGYTILDHAYTPSLIKHIQTWKQRVATLPRVLLFALNRDFASRLLGGYSLLVLAE